MWCAVNSPCILGFMCSYNWQQVIIHQKVTYCRVTVKRRRETERERERERERGVINNSSSPSVKMAWLTWRGATVNVDWVGSDQTNAHVGRLSAGVPVEIGTSSHAVVTKVLGGLFAAVVLAGVRPQQVAHRPECWRLFKPV